MGHLRIKINWFKNKSPTLEDLKAFLQELNYNAKFSKINT